MIKDVETGKISLGRLTALVMIVFYLAYAGYVVITKQSLPDIPSNYMILIMSLYGINKIVPKLNFKGGNNNG